MILNKLVTISLLISYSFFYSFVAKSQVGNPVDLGLTSGTLWSDINLGSTINSDFGLYYCWGENSTKEKFLLNEYKWWKSTYIEPSSYVDEDGFTHTTGGETIEGYTKYVASPYYGYDGFQDNKTILDPEDDAARSSWGENWEMPTLEQVEELRRECSWEWVSLNGTSGYKITGKNGNYIFLPAAGYFQDDYPFDSVSNKHSLNVCGVYLTNSLKEDYQANHLYISREYYSTTYYDNYHGFRRWGMSIRPVYSEKNPESSTTSLISYTVEISQLDGLLDIYGLSYGDTINIFTIDGIQIFNKKADDNVCSINLSDFRGKGLVLIINDRQSYKILIK